jgi:hypothetical protein
MTEVVHGNPWAQGRIGEIIEYDPRGFIIGYVPLPNGDAAVQQFSMRMNRGCEGEHGSLPAQAAQGLVTVARRADRLN